MPVCKQSSFPILQLLFGGLGHSTCFIHHAPLPLASFVFFLMSLTLVCMKFCNTESKHGYGYRGSSKISSSCCRAPAQPCFSSRLAAAFVSREAPSPSHIYFHGNPWKAFCSLKTTFALSSCKLALSRAECIPTALNEYKKKKKKAEFGWAVVIWEALRQERTGNLQVT